MFARLSLGLLMSTWLAVAGLTGAAYAKDLPEGIVLDKYLNAENPDLLQLVFPGAERAGPVEGEPPAAAVYKGDALVGYVYETWDTVQGVGFSKQAFHIVVGIDLEGVIQGIRLVHHVEPIAILGRTDDDFHQYLTQFPTIDVGQGVSVVLSMSDAILEGEKFAQRTTSGNAEDIVQVDAVSRTTTSSVLFSDSIVRGGRLVGRTRGFLNTAGQSANAKLDIDSFAEQVWPDLVAEGSISMLQLTHGLLTDDFAAQEAAPPEGVKRWKSEDPFLDVYLALVTPAGIGRNIMDKTWYDQYRSARELNDVMFLLMVSGPYTLLDEVDEETGVLTRIQLVQGDKTVTLTKDHFKGLPFLHGQQMPEFSEIGLFFLTEADGISPVEPWRLEMLMEGAEGGAVSYSVPYNLPARYIIETVPPAEPVVETAEAAPADDAAPKAADTGMNWQQVWQTNASKIGVLVATLVLLVLILSFQEAIVRHKRLHIAVRIGFLAWVLVWVGWYAGAQLTIINLLIVAQSVVQGFRWDFFLIDPLIFVIMAFTVIGLFLWGRAIFCGWLCPFGALQELLNKAARAVRLPQITIPHVIQERLFAVKYLIFLGLLGLTFYSFDLAIAGTTVEPFKTAITFRFDAPWSAVIYALVLLGIGLFIERFYCRFVCPLGAGLSILGRVRMFDWLKRRPECGNPCTRCEAVCPVGAVKASGEIDMNECFYCLDCQVMYYDDHQCPPLIARRKRADAVSRPAEAPNEQMGQAAE